jgi:glycogen(starch) synthase
MFLAAPRRLLLTADTEGGVWTFALALAQELLRQDINVCLASFGQSVSDSQRHSAAGIAGLQWFHHYSKLEWMNEPWTDIERAGRWLTGIVQQCQPDVIHMNTLCHGALPWNVPVVVTHHSCVLSWWTAVKRSPLPESWARYRKEVKRTLDAASAVIAPSQAALSGIKRHYDVEFDNAFSIHNGCNPELFRPADKEPFILSAGRLWDEGKNVTALGKMAPGLPWPVYLAGDTLNSGGKETRPMDCHLLGKLSAADLSRWYSRAAIYASPAFYEPFGLAVLEAALSGCALVLSDIPSLCELWNGAATFISPDDPRSLEGALRMLIADKGYREQMSEAALARGKTFTQARMAAQYIDAYRCAQIKYQSGRRRQACAS